ncbi:Acyl-transf-3 domain-containing protein [Aphelenchoides bicaudatus]|nr:Acyl-transf-3 domain-containing protein [Aphelenchoides bicaudatus]
MKAQQQLTASQNAPKLLNIQGLRGLAILAVLFYHLRPDICPNGFLGVDLFFSISGFLMYRILHTKLPLDMPKVITFYFRRFKRILPPYLFTILSTIFLSLSFFLHQIDFSYLFDEAWRPLLFVSNWPPPDEKDYSKRDNTNDYPFFKHMWSLSLEIQFYALVPLFFVLFHLVGKVFELFLIVLVGQFLNSYKLVLIEMINVILNLYNRKL